MLSAKPDDQAALDAAYRAIPAYVTPEDGGISMKFLDSGIALFTWEPFHKMLKPTSDSLADVKLWQDTQYKVAQRLKEDFAQHRDIAVSLSERIGPKGMYFWASGRVTESELVPNPVLDTLPSNQRARAFIMKHKEVLPAYDFLK